VNVQQKGEVGEVDVVGFLVRPLKSRDGGLLGGKRKCWGGVIHRLNTKKLRDEGASLNQSTRRTWRVRTIAGGGAGLEKKKKNH